MHNAWTTHILRYIYFPQMSSKKFVVKPAQAAPNSLFGAPPTSFPLTPAAGGFSFGSNAPASGAFAFGSSTKVESSNYEGPLRQFRFIREAYAPKITSHDEPASLKNGKELQNNPKCSFRHTFYDKDDGKINPEWEHDKSLETVSNAKIITNSIININ